jgi:hypothetical protein
MRMDLSYKFYYITEKEVIHNAVMKGLTNDQIGDCENTPIFPSEENWLGFQPRLSFPSGQGTMPASGFQTVFSITQSDYSMPQTVFSIITDMKMHTQMNL